MTFNRYAVFISSLALSSCTPAGSVIGTTELELMFNDNAGDITFALKNSKGLESCSPKINTDTGYSTWGGHCYLKGRNIPEQITLEYAEFMSGEEKRSKFFGQIIDPPLSSTDLTPRLISLEGKEVSNEEWAREGSLRVKAYLDSYPDSAWHTYTFYPKQIVKEYAKQKPKNGSLLKSGTQKMVAVGLIIQPDGSIKRVGSYNYKYSGEGWRN